MTRLQWDRTSLEKQGRRIVDDVSLSIAEGEIVGLVGPNGAGKTALLRLAVGLETPSHGKVLVNARPLAELSAVQRALQLAYLPQQAEAAWPISVRDAVKLGRLPHGNRDQGAVERALQMIGMEKLADRPLTRLSGGERALVLLARALAVESGLLLLDEPTASLDPAHQLQVMEILRKRANHGDAVVVVMHDLGLAARCCDRLLVLQEGRLVAEGGGDAILNDSLLKDVFRVTVERGHVQGQPVFLPTRWVA